MEEITISKAAHYRSFYDVAKMLKDEARLEFYVALDEYRFDNKEPVFKTHDAQLAFTAIRSFIDADKKRKVGGAPRGNTNATKQPKNNHQNNYENNVKTNNVNVNVNDNVNVNVNDNVNDKVNVNVNDKRNNCVVADRLTADTDFNSKITSDMVHDELQTLGYDCSMVSCGQIASIMNFNHFDLGFIRYMENVVSDRYTDISAPLMINALSTWVEHYDGYKKIQKAKEKKKAESTAPLTKCIHCGDKIGTQNWLDGKYRVYFCNKCGTNFIHNLVTGSWDKSDDLSA